MNDLNTLPWHKEPPLAVSTLVGERVVDTFNTHWVKYMPIMSVFVLIISVAMLLTISSGTNVLRTNQLMPKVVFLVGNTSALLVMHWFFHRAMSQSLEGIIITNRRFIYLEAHLWAKEEMHEISLNQIKAVESQKRGLTENIFRFGHLSFDTGGSDMSTRTFFRIPHPDRKAKIITDLLRTANYG